jgi:hypothetical protein
MLSLTAGSYRQILVIILFLLEIIVIRNSVTRLVFVYYVLIFFNFGYELRFILT